MVWRKCSQLCHVSVAGAAGAGDGESERGVGGVFELVLPSAYTSEVSTIVELYLID